MRIPLFALYAGPDQVMVVTSVFATALGFVLMLWNKLLGLVGKLLNRSGSTAEANEPKVE